MNPPSRHVILSMFLLLCCQHARSNDDRCVPGELAVATHTCNTRYNFCAWGNNYNNDFNWTRDYAYFCWSAWIYQKNAGNMAKLESRPICSSVNDEYFLEFDYRITMERNNICQLSVDLLVDNNAPTNLLRRQNHTSVFVHFNRVIIFNDSFQIVFQAISLENVNRNCWIAIDNVSLAHETVTTPAPSALPTTSLKTSAPHSDTTQTSEAPAAQPSQSAITPSSPPPSTAPISPSTFVRTSTSVLPETSVTSSDTAEQNPQTDTQSHHGPTAGAVIGIVIGAVLLAVIVVVCVGVILVARRKASGREAHLPWIIKNLFKHRETSPQNVSELDVVEVPNGQNIGSSETPHGASGAGSPTNTRGECPYEDVRETGGTYYSALDHRGNTDNTYSSLQNSYENATGKARENEEGSYTQLQRPSPLTGL